MDWVKSVFDNLAYISGMYYYVSTYQFLFFFSHFLRAAPEVRRRVATTFQKRVLERFRVGVEEDPLSLTEHILAVVPVEILTSEISKPSFIGNVNTSWNNGWFYKFVASGVLMLVERLLLISMPSKRYKSCRKCGPSQLNP